MSGLAFYGIQWQLPDWIDGFLQDWNGPFDDDAARMRLVIGLAEKNVESGSGGPFGAAVFNADSGQLVAPGVNLVTNVMNSCAHAEVVALSLAQRIRGTFDLSSAGPHVLVTSTEPCAMCLGAIPWSGVVKVVCGATGADAEAVGFDEGSKPADWVASLTSRNIDVVLGVEREAAAAVLRAYHRGGGEIYNSGRGDEVSD